MAVDPGFSPQRRRRCAGVRRGTGTARPTAPRAFFTSTIDRMRAIPGVQAAGAVSAMPFAMSNIDIKTAFDVVGRPATRLRSSAARTSTIASPATSARWRSRCGRDGSSRTATRETAPIVAVISEALRRREWPDESPIGRRIRIRWQGQPVEAEVVGVVSQIRHDGLDTAPRPEVFVPLAQFPFGSMTTSSVAPAILPRSSTA